MERATFTVSFFVKRTKKLKDGTSPIFVRITVNGERAEFGIQESIELEEWDAYQANRKRNTTSSRYLKALFDHIKFKLRQKKMYLEEENKVVTATSLKNEYLGIEEDNRTILQVIQEHNERCKNLIGIDYAEGTYERYNTLYVHVKNFINREYKKEDLRLSALKPSFIRDFEYYLKTPHPLGRSKDKWVKCGHNSATKYLKNLKKITRICLVNGWLKQDPFRGKRFHLKEVDMDYLTANELNTLINKKMTVERLELVKDVYVFCCFTGLAFIDVKNLSNSDLQQKGNQLWIHAKRKKTGNWFDVPVLPPARKLIEKYKSHPKCQAKNLVFPVLTNQKMNAYLKEIADVCGIQKNLSTHTARHTFATTVTLTNQISIEVVSKMLGHSSINMTKKYARVVDDLIQKDMTKVYKKYKTLYVA
jgi:integrase